MRKEFAVVSENPSFILRTHMGGGREPTTMRCPLTSTHLLCQVLPPSVQTCKMNREMFWKMKDTRESGIFQQQQNDLKALENLRHQWFSQNLSRNWHLYKNYYHEIHGTKWSSIPAQPGKKEKSHLPLPTDQFYGCTLLAWLLFSLSTPIFNITYLLWLHLYFLQDWSRDLKS